MTATSTKPRWAGDDLLSRCVNLMIRTKPLYGLMKQQARKVLIKTAEKHGVAWRQTAQDLKDSGAQAWLPHLTNAAVTYPDYYRVPFHAYDDGNLCWQAAFEAEPATYAMALRVWPQESLTWQAAQDRLRESFHRVLRDHGPAVVHDILDVGCSVGISTRSLHHYYRHTQPHPVRTVGLDLSPYMLTVAKIRDPQGEIEWRHAQAENSGLPETSFDVVTLQFVVHELPRTATQEILQAAWQLLRPGGCLAILDNNPRSAVIQNLPPVLFTLMKSTEPWSDDYYTFDLESAIAAAGFVDVVTVPSDPRHRTIVGKKPATLAQAAR